MGIVSCDLVISGIPFVTSKNGNKRVRFKGFNNENKIENSMMYPPILVIASKPFIMEESKIAKFNEIDSFVF